MLESQNGEINTKNKQALKDATDTIEKRNHPKIAKLIADYANSNSDVCITGACSTPESEEQHLCHNGKNKP